MTEESRYPVVRELTQGDRETFSALIEKLAERSGNVKITELVPGMAKKKEEGAEADDTDQVYALMKSVLGGLVKWCNADLKVWLMDITGVETAEEFGKLPFDVEMHILDQLVERGNFINFFLKASGLYKKIRGFFG